MSTEIHEMSLDTSDLAWDSSLHMGPVPMSFLRDAHEEPLRATLSGRRARLATSEELECELLQRIQDAESMRRHVPGFLERKLARVRERIERLQEQILSLEDQLGGIQ
jgi:hypothetical protein